MPAKSRSQTLGRALKLAGMIIMTLGGFIFLGSIGAETSPACGILGVGFIIAVVGRGLD